MKMGWLEETTESWKRIDLARQRVESRKERTMGSVVITVQGTAQRPVTGRGANLHAGWGAAGLHAYDGIILIRSSAIAHRPRLPLCILPRTIEYVCQCRDDSKCPIRWPICLQINDLFIDSKRHQDLIQVHHVAIQRMIERRKGVAVMLANLRCLFRS